MAALGAEIPAFAGMTKGEIGVPDSDPTDIPRHQGEPGVSSGAEIPAFAGMTFQRSERGERPRWAAHTGT